MERTLTAMLSVAAGVVITPLAAGCALHLAAGLSRCLASSALRRLRRATLAVLVAVAATASIVAQKNRTGGIGTTGVPSVAVQQTGVTGTPPVANEVTNTLVFADISVGTNVVTLAVAWPSGLFSVGTTIDLLAATSLVDSAWSWQCAHDVAIGETNWTAILERESAPRFYKAVVRESLPDMDDPDGDGLPNVYELAHGTNPYVADYAAAPRIVAGGTGADGVADLAAAFAASEEYSIIEVSSGIHSGNGWTGLHLPTHPVLVTSPDGGRDRTATLRHAGQMAAFYLSATQRTDTVVQGLCIDLVATSGQQMGFWCGGELPWSGLPAAGTFRNISLRMPSPGVRYFGWFFRHWESNEVVIAASTLNASGATDVRGIYAVDSPPMSVENCTFANFPPDEGETLGYGIQYETTSANWGNAPATIPLEIVNCLFDASFTNACVLAPLEQGVAYDVTMANCVVPSPLTHLPDHEYCTIVTNALTAWSGHILPGSPAIDAGTDAFYSTFDLDGQSRDARTDVGADEYVPGVVRDTDGDGISDMDEILLYGTDPYRADSDFDGKTDDVEIHDGTDPTDPHSFTQTLTVTATNTVSSEYTVYVAWGYSATGWETNGLAVFPSGFGETAYTNASLQSATHAKAYCDLNGNGSYDANFDILLVRPIPYGSTARIDFAFGDVDGDGVADTQERTDDTNPYDNENYCFDMSVTVTGIFNTTNQLTLVATFGGDTICGPLPITTNIWAMLFTHMVVTNRERIVLTIWDDANSNGACEAIETSYNRTLLATKRFNSVSFRLPYGRFDADNNGLLDWWEMQTGLNAVTNGGAYVDTDGDGLINLHEYWAGCDPLVPDGSNTLLSIISRSIDDRIRRVVASNVTKARFLNYNAASVRSGFQPNTNCWAHGIDLSCASPWNAWYGYLQAGTAITKRHLLFARHYLSSNSGEIYFHDVNGNIHTNRLVATNASSKVDITIGLLQNELPNSIHLARILPPSYEDVIGDGRGLPVLSLDYEEHVLVHDIGYLAEGVVGSYPVSSNRYDFTESIIPGDSGNPRFLVISNEVVLLNAFLSGGAGSGPFLTFYKTHVQQLMDELSVSYGLDTNLYQLVEFPLE